MTKQINIQNRLDNLSAAARLLRLCALSLTVAFVLGTGAIYAQAPGSSAEPAKQTAENKPATPVQKIIGGYQVHQQIELGGRIVANKLGSGPMWATMVNQGTGVRVLSHNLEMRSLNPAKTPFFDTLTSTSFGYGGDPNDVSYLNFSKGRWYDFAGSFRRDRNYFDYNLLANSLLSTANAANPVLVPEPDSLHLFNTVRRNTDATLTLFPLSAIKVRAGFNHGTHEGPAYSTLHNGGDVQLLQWFRNGLDTWTGGVDVRVAKRTTLSYDQFYAFYKGDTTFQLANASFQLSNGMPVSLGVDTLATAKCGTSGTGNYATEVVNGVANPFCSGTTMESEVAPIRNKFPTEQLRFSSHYFDKVSMNGRFLYSGGSGGVQNYNETFIGLNSRTLTREQSDTGGLPGGKLSTTKRVNSNADFAAEAELAKFVSVSDAITFSNFRIPTATAWNDYTLVGVATKKGPPVVYGTSMLTPLNDPSLTATTTPNTDAGFLSQRYLGNTLVATFTVTPEVKVSGGWRFNARRVAKDTDPAMNWHQNWVLLGSVIQPSRALRINLNYDGMNSKSADSVNTPTDTYTREAPNKINHFRARATITPAKWINLAVTSNDYYARNDDPLVNHKEHNTDFSFATEIIPTQTVSLNFNFARNNVFSQTDLCYAFTANPQAPLPTGASNAGTCTVDNGGAANLYLGTGYYSAPTTFFQGGLNFAPSKYFKFNGGARITSTDGQAEMLNPLMVPGALQSKVVSPYSDLVVNVAKQWAWHGFWEHHGYDESGSPGPAARSFHGDVITLGVQYAF